MAILLWGVPTGDDFTWDMTYKFKTEECTLDATGATTAFATYSHPTREIKFALGATRDEAYDRLSAFLRAGADFVTVPLWFLRTSLAAAAYAGSQEFLVSDTSELFPGDQALLMKANQPATAELITISAIAGSTVYTTTPITNYYSPTFWGNYSGTPENILEDSGFESGELISWVSVYNEPMLATVTTGDTYSGTYKVTLPGQGQLASNQSINLVQDTYYELSFYGKDVDGFGASFSFGIYDSNDSPIASKSISLSTSYAKYTISFTPSQNYSGCKIMLGGGGPTSHPFFIDEVQLNKFGLMSVYNTSFAYLIPVLTGILDYEGLDFIDGLPGVALKAKVDGGAWSNYSIPALPTFNDVAMDAKYNSPKMTRDLLGVDNGVLALYPYGTSSKLTFECTWNFKDSNWKTLRDLFFAAHGKAEVFNISTFMYEVRTTRGADQGSTTIFLNASYQYLYKRFPFLKVYSRRTGDQFIVHVTDYVMGEQFTCDALPHEVYDGDLVCFYPSVRFNTDELTFSFKGVNMCTVKATFVEEWQD